MKKIHVFFALVAFLLVFSVPIITSALEFRSGDNPSIQANEKVLNDMYIAGGAVTVSGNIPGDLISAGGNVVVRGNIGADVMAAGGNLTILSNVGDDVRVAGGTIVIEGKVGGDVLIGGGQVTIGGAGVGGDLMIGGGNVRIDAPVAGKVMIGGGSVYINAPISGDVKIEADKVTLGSAAIISGNLTYKASKELVLEDGAVVKGKTTFEPRKTGPKVPFYAVFSIIFVLKFFALLVCALLFGLFFRRYSKEFVAHATSRPVFEIGRGFLILAATPVISILLLISIIGIPLGILGMIGFIALMMFSWIMAPVIVGGVVYKYFSKKDLEISWKIILLGVLIVSLLGCIPFIGPLVLFFLMLLALGCITALKFRIIKEWR